MTFRLPIVLSLLFFPFSTTWLWPQNRENPMDKFQGTTDHYQNLWRTGQYEEALETLTDAIVKSTDGVPMLWLYDQADILFDLGKVDEAISEIEWLHYRRPSPRSALQLAKFFKARGRYQEYMRTLEQAARRYRRFQGGSDETDNAIAMIRIKELLGENPRQLFQTLLSVEEREPKNTIKRYLAAAALAYRKFDYQLSSENYQKALELDQDNLEAKIGLAECYWKSNDPRLEGMLEEVKAVNPIHPRVAAIQVEMHLDNGRTAEALPLIDKVLSVNPRQMTFLAYKSAAYFLTDRLDDMRIVQQEGLLFNERASELFRITGRIASRHYRFEEALNFQKKALEIDPDDTAARALYAFDLLRLGKNEEGLVQLQTSFEADRFNVQVYNMLELMDNLKEFKKIRRGPFLLQMPRRETLIWSEEALGLLEEAYHLYGKKYDIELKQPIGVQIFDNHDDFMVRSVGLPGSVGYLGICFGQLITMDSPSARAKGTMNWRATLWHEFVHVITLQKTKNRMPRWLSEGISVYEEVQRNPSWGQRLDPHYKAIVDEGDLPGIEDLEPFFTRPKTQIHLMFGYFLAGEFVTFYVNTYGFPSLVKSLELIAQGTSAQDALVQASGDSHRQLDRKLATFLERRFEKLKNLPETQTSLLDSFLGNVASSNPLEGPSPFTNALERGKTALAEGQFQNAEEALKEAHKLFPEFTNKEGPLGFLAQLYESQDNQDGLIGVLETKLAADGSDFAAAYQLTRLYQKRKEWPEVARTSAVALEIDPFDVSMRKAYQKSLEETGKQERALSVLEQLVFLDPNRSSDYRLRGIDILIRSNRLLKAKQEVLRLLEEIPYAWEAQSRLLTIVERMQPKDG